MSTIVLQLHRTALRSKSASTLDRSSVDCLQLVAACLSTCGSKDRGEMASEDTTFKDLVSRMLVKFGKSTLKAYVVD